MPRIFYGAHFLLPFLCTTHEFKWRDTRIFCIKQFNLIFLFCLVGDLQKHKFVRIVKLKTSKPKKKIA